MRRLATSRYAEDSYEGNHKAVFGSYYCSMSGRWGYACCLLCERSDECGQSLPALEQGPAPSEATTRAGSAPVAGTPLEPPARACELGSPVEASPSEPSARVCEEIRRILSAPAGQPLQILGLPPKSQGYAVRSAFRRIALLIHPDKNPGSEDQCKQALLRAQAAREALEAEQPSTDPARGKKRKRDKETFDASSTVAAAAKPREHFSSAEVFIAYAMQFILDEWRRCIRLPLASDQNEQRDNATARNRAAEAAATLGGVQGVLRSEAALQQTSRSVKQLRKLVKSQELGADVVEKIEHLCMSMLSKEYQVANKAYMDLALGNRTWQMEVPTLMEGGMTGMNGVERGRMWKQARTAQKMNASRTSSVMDDAEVKAHMVALRRLLTVAQVMQPNEDPSKNAG